MKTKESTLNTDEGYVSGADIQSFQLNTSTQQEVAQS